MDEVKKEGADIIGYQGTNFEDLEKNKAPKDILDFDKDGGF